MQPNERGKCPEKRLKEVSKALMPKRKKTGEKEKRRWGIEFFDYVKDYIIDHGNMCVSQGERLGLMTATSFQNLKLHIYENEEWSIL